MRAVAIAWMFVAGVGFAADQPRQCSELGNVIDAAYRQILGRHMTPEELSRGTRSIGSGTQTVSDLVKTIVLSDEYQNKLKGLSPSEQAESLYKHVLGRAAGPDLDAAAELIKASGVRTTAESLINGSEYRQRFARNAVPAAPGSKVKTLCQ